MSKISAISWVTIAVRGYSKRFAASVTGFAHKYRDDFFVRTEVNIITLQVVYAALILSLAIGSLIVLYHDIVGGVGTAIASALLSTSTPLSSNTILDPLQAARAREIAGLAGLIALATAIFGFLVARLALLPARNALTAQKQFIGNIAHELRTPLSIIKTNTEVRLLEKDIPDAARKVHQSNLEELDRISDIINNLLSLNTLVRPERIPFDNVDLGKITRRAVEKLSYLAHKKPIHIKIRVAKERTVWGNATALEQVVLNIVKNAIHYTPAGDIVITVGLTNFGSVELTVRDSGVGIKREDLYRIFEPFYRGDRARTRSGGSGSGLGLAIVSELVKLHHGRVDVRSAPGEGTTVTVVLPQGKKISEDENSHKRINEISADYSTTAPRRS